MDIDVDRKRKEMEDDSPNEKSSGINKRKRGEDESRSSESPEATSSEIASPDTSIANFTSNGEEGNKPDIVATFDNSKWDWLNEFSKFGEDMTTFIGPYIPQDEDLFGSELVGEGEAIAIWQIMKALHKMGYLCPHMGIPGDFDPDDYVDLYDDADFQRLKSLPLGVAYLMLRDDPQKEINIHDNQGIFRGTISHFGVPPNSTWLRVFCTTNSKLGREFMQRLEEMDKGTNEFGFAAFTHQKYDITDEKYLTAVNSFVNQNKLRLFAKTGLIDNTLATMFTLQKGEIAVAKALVNYRNSTMSTGGPNILQVEVAKEWQSHNILAWLLVCIEDMYVHKFARCLRGNSELLYMTTGNIDATEKDSDGQEKQDLLSNLGYDGHGSEMWKSLVLKSVKHDLKESLTSLASKPLPPERPNMPKDLRLNFVSMRAQALAEQISASIPDKELPDIAVALTKAAMDPVIPDVNKPPALFTASRKSHNKEVSKSIAEAVVCALPKERSQSSSDGSKDSKLGSTAVVDEVSDALVRKMVEAIPEKAALATAMVEASSDLDVQDDAMDKARAVVATAAEEGSISSTEKEDCAETKKEKSDLVEAVVRALPDAEVGNLAMGVDEKELTDVNIIKETQAGMGLSGALADAVTKVIPDRVLPEVAVAMTQAVIQEISDKDVMDSKYSVPTVTERGPGALANSVLNVVPDKMVPEVAVALTEAVMGAVPDGALGGKKLKNPVPNAMEPTDALVQTVLKSVPDELMPEVAVALTKSVIGKIPDKDMSVSSSGSMKEDKLGSS